MARKSKHTPQARGSNQIQTLPTRMHPDQTEMGEKSRGGRRPRTDLAAEEDPLDVDRHGAAGVPHGGRLP